MQKCEICGKKIRDYKMFSPKGLLDMVFVCKECHEQGRAAEWGEISAVNYFTKQIDVSKATEKGKKCIDQCLSNAKETIENKMQVNKTQKEEKQNAAEWISGMLVTTADTIADDLLYYPMVFAQNVVLNSNDMNVIGIIDKMTDDLKRLAYQKFGNIHGIIGLKINTMVDVAGNILVIAYGTPVAISPNSGHDSSDLDENWDEDNEEDFDEVQEDADE